MRLSDLRYKFAKLYKRIVKGERDLSDLRNTIVNLDSGAEITVLDTGAVIDSEAEAMLQALHSRSTGGIRAHLETLRKKGASNFMKSFYVGYGHKSIGDCGTTTIFVEGVSFLTAKAVQDNPLYAGQESSTRYIDFSKQPFFDPTLTEEGKALLEMQREFYLRAQDPTREYLRRKHPLEGDEKTYTKAIDARVFDITRGLLPAGGGTNLAWHTNLRQAADKLIFLRHHPLEEVRRVAKGIEVALQKHHPNSFGHKRYEATENYQDLVAENYLYHDPNSPLSPRIDFSHIDLEELARYSQLLKERPKKTELPKYIATAGHVSVEFQLDYGSFRDIQRHRAIIQRMPLLTQDLGFNEWYRENLPENVQEKLPEHLQSIRRGIESLGVSPEIAQYFIPIGYNTSNKFVGDIPATVYMIETRDSRFVHPTLQSVAHDLGRQVTNTLGIPIHVDTELGIFDVGRGKHDIELKK